MASPENKRSVLKRSVQRRLCVKAPQPGMFCSVSSCSDPFCLLLPPPPVLLVSPSVSWFLLVLSQQLFSHTSFCSLWLPGGSRCGPAGSRGASQSCSPGRVRLISGLSGLVLTGGARTARGVWVADAPDSGGRVGAEGALVKVGVQQQVC